MVFPGVELPVAADRGSLRSLRRLNRALARRRPQNERLTADSALCTHCISGRGDDMQTKIQKWGNSLGLRIPRSFAAEAQVEEGATVDLSVERGRLLVRPLRVRKYSLRGLLRKVSRRNLHEEVSTGRAVGREAW